MAKNDGKKDDELEDELADFDPEAPPENPPDELAIERNKMRMQIGALVLLFVAIVYIFGRALFGGEKPDRIVPRTLASPTINLQGLELATLGSRLEGPFVLVDVKNSQQITMSLIGGNGAETFTLIGLDGKIGTYKEPGRSTPGTTDPAETARLELQAKLQPMETAAIREFCGPKRHFILRKTTASAALPSLVYLIQPDGPGSETADPRHPVGPGILVNAELIRQGKAMLKIEQQPFFDPPMLDCELVAITEARRATAAGKKIDSIWTQFDLPMPDIPNLAERMKRVEAYAR